MHESPRDLLRSVEKEAEGRLDPALKRAVLDEIAAHLDASIQARMELGDSLEEAERNAVAEFGNPKLLVKGLTPKADASWFDRRFFLRTGLASLGLFLTGYCAWHLGDQSARILVLSAAGVLLGVAGYESVRARRVQFLPLLALFACTTVIGAAGQAYFNVPGPSAASRADVARQIASVRQIIRDHEARIAEYDRMKDEFQAGRSVAPQMTKVRHRGTTIRYVHATRSEGQNMWTDADAQWRRSVAAFAQADREIAWELQQALDRPWPLDSIGWLGVSAEITFYPAATLFAWSLMFSGTAALIRSLRRNRSKRLTA